MTSADSLARILAAAKDLESNLARDLALACEDAAVALARIDSLTRDLALARAVVLSCGLTR